jgi:general secretion pathway protein D
MNAVRSHVGALAFALLAAVLLAGDALAQGRSEVVVDDDMVQLDFNDAELTTIIDAISKMTNRNFIYDERVRGNVTIKSPTPISKEQAYAVFESVLQVKGFTTVETPGGALKVIPVRDAKETNVETVLTSRIPPNADRYITRLIPLKYIEAEPIVNTLKPLVSKDASIAAYGPTNTVILTEAASNIRRILAILEAIDVETYKEELAVIKIEHADAATLANQVSEIYGAEVSSAGAPTPRRSRSSRRAANAPAQASVPAAVRGKVRLITDARTNSLIVLAPRAQLADVRKLVNRLDVPVSGGGRIHVYYLQHADATDLSQTLSSLIGGSGGARRAAPPTAGGAGATSPGAAQSIRAAVSALAGGIRITADPATNSLVIQASKEGYDTIVGVIEMLDVERPQVLVEALIMEIDVTNSEDLGFSGIVRFINGGTELSTVISPATVAGLVTGGPAGGAVAAGLPLVQRFISDTRDLDEEGNPTGSGAVIDTVIAASAGDAGTNIISAPHILTMDNEQAEIRIGQNIPIITNRIESAQGQNLGLSSSVNVERQDIGVTLRVTPHITEGESLRMEIYQEISAINAGLSDAVGNAEDVGVPLTERTIENTVVINDGETVVIGGLLSDEYQDTVSKVPFLGDIPILGWAFKTTSRTLRKINLLIFLTPHIVRTPDDLERQTIQRREEFALESNQGLEWSERERAAERTRQKEAEESGEEYEPRGENPVRIRVLEHESRYPIERLDEIEAQDAAAKEKVAAEALAALEMPYYAVSAFVSGGENEAIQALQEIIDSGYDATLVSSQLNGRMAFELQVGPYASLSEAQHVRSVVASTHGLNPSIVVVSNPNANAPGSQAP